MRTAREVRSNEFSATLDIVIEVGRVLSGPVGAEWALALSSDPYQNE